MLTSDSAVKAQSSTISLASESIKQVTDFKYLGWLLMDCSKDFVLRKALARNAAIKLVKIWKNKHIKEEIKYNLFQACVESTLLCNTTNWTMTKTLEKTLDGFYRRLLRYSLGLVCTVGGGAN